MRWVPLFLAIGIIVAAAMPVAAFAQESLPAPGVTATSVYAFDPETGEVIVAQNSDERLAIGSVTKVVTALVVRDYLSLDDQVVIASSDLLPDGYSSMQLQPGDTLTVEQLLTGMLVASGGDAALALARTVGMEIGGSDDSDVAVAAFVEAMNRKVSDLGLSDSQFANPDGMDSADGWSTAHDVAHLFAALREDPALAEISGLTGYSFSSVGSEASLYEGFTTNELAENHRIAGAKTGSEINAGGCLVLARDASIGGGSQIVAVLGSDLVYDETWTPTVDARWDDARTVMDTIDANWTPGQFLAGKQEVAADQPVVAAGAEATVVDAAAAPYARVTLVEEGDVGMPPSSASGLIVIATVAWSVFTLAAVSSWTWPGARLRTRTDSA